MNEDSSPDRVLCPDEACIGVLGEDGKCPECGAIGEVPATPSAALAAADDGSVGDPEVATEAGDDDAFGADRELCPDGACIGVIGPDGRCKTCRQPGRSAALDPRQRAKLTDGELEALGREELATTSDDSDAFDDDRELCVDGSCIGLIGDDGRCKECGLSTRAVAS